MKKLIFTLSLILSVSLLVAQENTLQKTETKIQYESADKLKSSDSKKSTKNSKTEKTELKLEKSETSVGKTEPVIIQHLEYNSENNNTIPVVVKEISNEEIESQIAIKESYIKSIDTKVESVKNNKGQHKKAKKSGWYDQMEKNKKEAQLTIEGLKKTKK